MAPAEPALERVVMGRPSLHWRRRSGTFREDLLRRANGGSEIHGVTELVEHLLQGGQRGEHVEVSHVAHVTETEDPPLHLALATRDRDVVRGGIRRDDLLAVD